ncbi:hypothetical protein Pth03_08780 [Planotetraspora thailandica]|uniref:Uncharacterized protein n=1 Tax=Planotetraspora thailandica TaxID=487172 RepID=A0A8J3XTS9_9ACTN|nr:hypothetical protein [Planotetraspora thailandica]GII52489.1 hypothetical protein Pth03_08780 [Planotetraspora thailandica]
MLLLFVPLVVLAALAWGAWGSVRAVRNRAWAAPGTWARSGVLAGAGTLLFYGYGLLTTLAYDIGETCTQLRGQTYDDAYRAAHWREPSQWFPLHNRCNADYDLVPAYVNPTLVVLAAVTLGCVIPAVILAVRRSAAGR